VIRLKTLILAGCVLLSSACASSEMANFEAAKFALDKGNYTEAINKATTALNADSTNIEVARVLASAYLARSGIDFLDLAEGMVDLANGSGTNFSQIAALLPTANATTESDLRAAIEVLKALDGVTDATISDEGLADAAFDLAVMQTIESFSIGVYGSGQKTGTLDVTNISSTDRNNVQNDLVDFDSRFIGSGVDSTEGFLDEIRKTFCVLKPISNTEGFTLGEYQAYVGCQLSSSPDTFNTTVLTSGTVANCSAIDPDSQSTSVQSCYDTNTAL